MYPEQLPSLIFFFFFFLIYLPDLIRTHCFLAVDVACVGSAGSCFLVSARTRGWSAGDSGIPFLSPLFPCITIFVARL